MLEKNVEQFGQENKRDGYLKKWGNIKTSTAKTLNHIDKYCDYFEKYKNLIKWKDPQMTEFFFYVIIVVFFIVTFLPLRFFIAFGYIFKYFKGIKYHKKRITHNEELCDLTLENFYKEMRINVEKNP
jgi:hypothetical protein